MIPLMLWIRVKEEGKRGLALPIPLFLVWMLVGALLLLLLPLVLLAALLSWPWGWGLVLLKIYFHIFVMLGSMSGLKLDISSRENGKITRIVMQ